MWGWRRSFISSRADPLSLSERFILSRLPPHHCPLWVAEKFQATSLERREKERPVSQPQ